MLITLKLTNFRRHASLELEFEPKFNLVSGRNNAGKTTIFYAIEYVQFGTVPGFKKLASLVSFGKKNMAVELVFQGRDEQVYKLVRSHSFTAKAAKGTFELCKSSEKIPKHLEEAKWELVISSQNKDKETDLSLKLNELLGISRRFFETAVHFYQGRIPDILGGSPKLDIVFGITAANALIDAFKTKSSIYENKQRELEAVLQQIQLLQKEKATYVQILAGAETDLHECEQALAENQTKTAKITGFKGLQERIIQKYDPFEVAYNLYQESRTKYDAVLEELREFEHIHSVPRVTDQYQQASSRASELEEAIQAREKELDKLNDQVVQHERSRADLSLKNAQSEAITRDVKKLVTEWGDAKQLESEISQLETDLETQTRRLEAISLERRQLQDKVRDCDRDLGDTAGILERRVSTKGKPQCEYCGAAIDSSSLKSEIQHLQTHQTELQATQAKMEKSVKELDKEEEALRSNERDNTTTLAQKQGIASQLIALTKQQKQQGNISNITSELEGLEQQVHELEQKKGSIKQELAASKQESRELQERIAEYRKVLDQISILQKNQAKWERNATNGRIQVEDESRLLQTQMQPILKELAQFVQENPTFHPDLQSFITSLQDPSQGAQLGGQTKKNKKATNSVKGTQTVTSEEVTIAQIQSIKAKMNDIVIAVDSESGAQVNLLQKQLQEKNQQYQATQQSIARVDQQITALEADAAKNKDQINMGERYTRFQAIFQDVQNRIRQNISHELEKKILYYHRLLSSDDEFKEVRVDPEDYSLSVMPHDDSTGEFSPALVYQGGGHRLMLGLAYKFALSELIGSPPYLLIDEPTEFMDQKNRGNLLTNLSKMSHSAQIILITHQDVDKIHSNRKIELMKE